MDILLHCGNSIYKGEKSYEKWHKRSPPKSKAILLCSRPLRYLVTKNAQSMIVKRHLNNIFRVLVHIAIQRFQSIRYLEYALCMDMNILSCEILKHLIKHQKLYFTIYSFPLRYTYLRAFKGIVQEVDDYAGQRERISEALTESVLKEMHHLSSQSKSERRKVRRCSFGKGHLHQAL